MTAAMSGCPPPDMPRELRLATIPPDVQGHGNTDYFNCGSYSHTFAPLRELEMCWGPAVGDTSRPIVIRALRLTWDDNTPPVTFGTMDQQLAKATLRLARGERITECVLNAGICLDGIEIKTTKQTPGHCGGAGGGKRSLNVGDGTIVGVFANAGYDINGLGLVFGSAGPY